MSRVLADRSEASAVVDQGQAAVSRALADLRRIAPYVLVALGGAVAAALMLRPWSFGPGDAAFLGGDPLWVQAMMQLHGQAGIFGVSDHLAWPEGASPWSLPQMGMLAGGFAWVTIGGFGLAASAATLWFVACSAGLNAAAILYLFRGTVGSALSVLAGVMAVCLGSSYWVISKWGTPNLALFALIPLALGVLVRWERLGPRARWAAAVVVAVAAVVSPLWWVVVAALSLPLLALSPLFRREWPQLRGVVIMSAATWLGAGIQGVIAVVAAGPMSDVRRQAADSDLLGGNFAMLLNSSPFVNQVVAPLQSLNDVGWWEDMYGGVTAGLAVVAIVVLVAVPPRRLPSGASTSVLASATIVALLYYLSGGLGNLQSSLAVVMGTVSPARWWSRVLVVVAILGAVWLLALLHRRQVSSDASRGEPWRWVSYGLAAVMAVLSVLDFAARPGIVQVGPVPPELDAVRFLQDRTEPCPVAQLPVNGIPNSQLAYEKFVDPLLYRGLLPYVLAPDHFWSAGASTAPAHSALAASAASMGARDLAALRDQGYCAVLFSTRLSEQSLAENVELPGREISGVNPDFVNASYEVYLLSR